MPVDPQIQALLELRAKLPPLHTLSVADARAQMAARDIPGLRKPDVGSVVNRDMQGPAGSLPLRIYTPKGEAPFPLMVFFHGSGFVVCDLDTHDSMCRSTNFRRRPTIASPRHGGSRGTPRHWVAMRGASWWRATARGEISRR
jgi:acetyl esterase/lipase